VFGLATVLPENSDPDLGKFFGVQKDYADF
jgi:hypothetical protein